MATNEQMDAWNEVRGRGVEGELSVALEVWSEQRFADSTLQRLAGLIIRFATRLQATGVTSLRDVTLADCEGYFWARTRRNAVPSVHTMHLRRTAVRGLFAALHQLELESVDPTRGLDLPPRSVRRARPLTDNELTTVRVAALGRVRSPERAALAVALAEATATTGEIPQIRWRHVDLVVGTVALPGANPILARTGALTSWGKSTLMRVSVEAQPLPSDFVVSRRGGYADPHTAQAAMANLLAKVLHGAGVNGSGVRPTSIRLWGGARVLDTRGVEAAAAALGITSLDAVVRSFNQDRVTS